MTAVDERLAVARLLLGGSVFAFAVLSALFPYRVARLGELKDAIGSTTPFSDVEPATWKVLLTRLSGVVVAVLALAWTWPAIRLLLFG